RRGGRGVRPARRRPPAGQVRHRRGERRPGQHPAGGAMTSTAVGHTARTPLPEHEGSWWQRAVRATTTPGGAIVVLALVLLVAVIVNNPSFGEPGSLMRFVGRTAPIAIAAVGQYFVIVSGEFDLSMGAVI